MSNRILSVLATRTCSKRRLSEYCAGRGIQASRTTLISTTFSLADQSVDALSNNHHVGTFAGGFEARRWECENRSCRGAASWKRVQHRLVYRGGTLRFAVAVGTGSLREIRLPWVTIYGKVRTLQNSARGVPRT